MVYISSVVDANTGWQKQALEALEEQLRVQGERLELVVGGGAALIALGLVERATRDVDVVALRSGEGLAPADPLPEPLASAAATVARDLGLPRDWLNPGPTELLDFGLPEGFLYAMVDQAGGRHEQDLRGLKPSAEELLAAGRWTRTHDPSPAFRDQLALALERLGIQDADLE